MLTDVGLYQTQEEIANFIDEWEHCILPPERWMHAAHLMVALWYLTRYPDAQATQRIRSGIRAYNDSRGLLSTPSGGYHETITLFYIKIISHYLHDADLSSPFPTLFQGLMREYGHKKLLMQYYSRPCLLSVEARTGWVEPDLRSLKG